MEDFASCTLPISRYGKGPKASVMVQLNNFEHLVEDVSMAWPKFLERFGIFLHSKRVLHPKLQHLYNLLQLMRNLGRLGRDTRSAHGHNHRGYSCTFHISCPEIVEQGICFFFNALHLKVGVSMGRWESQKNKYCKSTVIHFCIYLRSLQRTKLAWGFFGVFRLFSFRDESHCLEGKTKVMVLLHRFVAKGLQQSNYRQIPIPNMHISYIHKVAGFAWCDSYIYIFPHRSTFQSS